MSLHQDQNERNLEHPIASILSPGRLIPASGAEANMPHRRTGFGLAALLIAVPTSGAAQQAPAPQETTEAQIQRTLRAFYFNLARGDWEALTADILPAKVVAHRFPPAAPGPASLPVAGQPGECVAAAAPPIHQATIRLDGDWAEVSVPRCSAVRAADEFRLIRFAQRWRFVYIHLFQELPHLSTER